MNSQSVSLRNNRAVVLCIEDEDALRRDITDELVEAGYVAIEASDGNQALELLNTTRPDLILCDISMPGRDGYEVLKAVHAKGAGFSDIPFVFLTALGDPRQVVEGKRLGADDYLVKPIDYDLLLATVGARLRQIERIRSSFPSVDPSAGAATAAASFGLTASETRIVLALVEGRQLSQIADSFNISRTTVAFHMRNIFQKTRTSRQAELVTLLLRQP
ncbi:response regulator transcription factor [Aquamicrobium zhengzhouense]|uniref:Response regulator n=1 Tax=Aquamicrobium zhengzhouense TaxID=2781738 RepID=A0ABS0SIN7_9HYPH|nr:response regulator [Aquamicrobium zhengzhouense]MBI1622691.1 response regulator [Aquamicrobium zhengzhouense]